jgi:hypothetical protein
MKKMKITPVFIILAIIGLFGSLSAETIELRPVEIAGIQPRDTVRSTGPRLLMQFDIPDSLVEYEIVFATIEATGTFFPYGREDNFVILEYYPLLTSWNGRTATWTYPWRTEGGDFDAEDRNFTSVEVGFRREVSLDVTSMVQDWVDGSMDDHGLIVVPTKSDLEPYRLFRNSRRILFDIRMIIEFNVVFDE